MYKNELLAAILEDDLEKVKYYLAHGADINGQYGEEKDTPLMVALEEKKTDIVDYLIEEGADLTLVNAKGKTALSIAVANNTRAAPSINIIIALIKWLAIEARYIDDKETDSLPILINKLITSLLYESNRHGWDSKNCLELRTYISYLNPIFKDQDKDYFDYFIQWQETQNKTFYGSHESDDSDSAEENSFRQNNNEKEKKQLHLAATVYMSRAQIEKLTYQRTTKKGEFKPFKDASTTFDLSARTTIHYGQQVNQTKLQRDLNHLNLLLKRKASIEDALTELKKTIPEVTQFFVAEYRGITHLTTKWNQSSRKAHRDDDSEMGKAQYSASVMAAANLNFFRQYAQAKAELAANPEEMTQKSALLREILLTMREARPYSYKGYTYNNLAYLLQNIYTQDYAGFHELIKTHPILKHLLLNDANPFFSMGDIPYHAEKYAHGIKPYKGFESYRLRPRWRNDGRAERPYSGVVYASLHPLTDFTQEGPLHLISLNRAAEIKLDSELLTIPERESCFPALLPEDRIFFKHKAKYPSFKGLIFINMA